MKKLLFSLIAAFVFCLSLVATTNMCVQLKNGNFVRYDVEEVEQVFYEELGNITPYDTAAIDTFGSPLKFEITSDSTVMVVANFLEYRRMVNSPAFYGDTTYYLPSDSVIIIPSKIKIDNKTYQVTKIGQNAFSYWRKLTNIKIPESINIIKDSAFAGCINLKNIELPNSITAIGCFAFAGCTKLTSINIPASVISFGSHWDLESDVEIWDEKLFCLPFYECYNLTSINVHQNNPYYSSIDGILYDKKKTTLISTPEGYYKDVVIPTSVDSICNDAFMKCGKIRNITIPNGIKRIEYNTFFSCHNLQSINIPESVDKIENYAFYECFSLQIIRIPSNVKFIGQDAFVGCNNLGIEIDNSKDNVTVENNAFKGCRFVTWLKE